MAGQFSAAGPGSRQARDGQLHQFLQQRSAEIFGTASEIVDLQRTRSDSSSSYAAEIVTVQLASGDHRKIYLKNFGSCLAPKEGARERRERELRVYQELLVEAALGTAR